MSLITAPPLDPPDGVRTWLNPTNGFTIARVHYTADPAKRSAEWFAAARAGMSSRGWRREYEIDWTAPKGEPVTPEFTPATMVVPVPVLPSARLLRGWDFGRVSPAVVFGQLSEHGQLRILAELIPFNTDLKSLIPMVKSRTLDLSAGALRVFDAGDPAGLQESDLGSPVGVLKAAGIVLSVARPGTANSYDSLRARLRATVYVPGVGLVPALVVHPRCINLIEALSGAFHLRENPPYRPNPIHPYKDVVDALRYLNDNLDFANTERRADLRQMSRRDWAWA